jgi:hypothetical protein
MRLSLNDIQSMRGKAVLYKEVKGVQAIQFHP